jgi:hypothetical protein
MRKLLIICTLFVVGLAVLQRSIHAVHAADTVSSPVVVELFTSQGCSSCPPAEAFLNDLAKREDVIALEFHVTYWDYIGWKDPFASGKFTDRQKSYVKSLGGRYAYTPQMVIAGQDHVVGSHRGRVNKKIKTFSGKNADAPSLTLSKQKDGKLRVQIGAAAAEKAYDILFVTFDKPHRTKVSRGENSGQTLINANVVRSLRRVSQWTGQAMETVVEVGEKSGNGGCAIILQQTGHGPIVAAAQLPF